MSNLRHRPPGPWRGRDGWELVRELSIRLVTALAADWLLDLL